MGLDRSTIFASVGHQTSCDIYCSINSSVLKSQLFINLSLSQVVASFQVQIQLVWNIKPALIFPIQPQKNYSEAKFTVLIQEPTG